jgi:festuclavine dehydrogenase
MVIDDWLFLQVADILSSLLGRKITHAKLSEAEMAKCLESTGMPIEDAQMLAGMDSIIKSGAEERKNTVIEDVTGTPPLSFKDFAVREKSSWVQESVPSLLQSSSYRILTTSTSST